MSDNLRRYRAILSVSPKRRVALATPRGDADLAPQNACRQTHGKPEADMPEISSNHPHPIRTYAVPRSRSGTGGP